MKNVNSLPYPDNLITDLNKWDILYDHPMPLVSDIADSPFRTLPFACLTEVINEEERMLILSRYLQNKSIKKLSEKYGVSCERIDKQITGIQRKIVNSRANWKVALQLFHVASNPHLDSAKVLRSYMDRDRCEVIDFIESIASSKTEVYELLLNNKFIQSLLLNGAKNTVNALKDYTYKPAGE